MSGSAEEAISEAAQRWTKELAHLGGMLERVAEHLSWRANQCNLAARAAKDADDEATDRLRTLQAREFFRGAARMAEGKQAGIHLISANNMTRRLDVTLAIIEYRRLLDDPEMAELVPLLRDAMSKAQAMEVAELQAAKGDEHQAARTDPRGWQVSPNPNPSPHPPPCPPPHHSHLRLHLFGPTQRQPQHADPPHPHPSPSPSPSPSPDP